MHVDKYKSSQVSSLIGHDMRSIPNHTNEQIDGSRSHLNYNLHSGNPFENLKARLEELSFVKKKTTNVIASWAVTAPAGVDLDLQKEFLKEMYDWLVGRYGSENVVSAYVHLDETTPHMHFKFVPAVGGKLSAKDLLNRYELKVIHKEAEKAMAEKFGVAGMILNGATVGGNKSIAELKLRTLEKKLAEKNEDLENVISKVEALNEDLPAEKPLYEPKKGLLGSVVTVKAHNALVNEFNGLLALERDRQRSVNLWKSQFEDEKKRFKALESDFEAFKRLDMPKEVLTLREANLSLKNDNRQLQKQLEELVDDNKVLKEDLEVYKGFFDNFFGALQKASQSVIDMIEPYIPMNFKEWFYRAFRGFERD